MGEICTYVVDGAGIGSGAEEATETCGGDT